MFSIDELERAAEIVRNVLPRDAADPLAAIVSTSGSRRLGKAGAPYPDWRIQNQRRIVLYR
jgi:hypothetical protein